MSSGNVTSPHRPALAPLDSNTPRVGKEAKPTFVKRLSAALHRKSTSSLYDDSEEAVTVEKERRCASATSLMDAPEASSMDEVRRRLVPSAAASQASGAPATALETMLQTPAVAEFLRAHSDATLLAGGERVRCAMTNVVMWADIVELKGHWSSKRYRQAAGSGRNLVGGASRKSRAKTTPVTCAVPSEDSPPAWDLSTGRVDPTLPTEPAVEPITATSEPPLDAKPPLDVESPLEPPLEPATESTVEDAAEFTVETNDPDPWSLVDEAAVLH